MDLSLINPYVRLAIPSVIPAGHNVMRRVIYDYELIYIEQGSFTFTYDRIDYRCTKGDIIFICPGVTHCFNFDSGEISQPHIHFDVTHRINSDIIPISFTNIDDMTETEKSWIHENYFSSYNNLPLLTVQNKEKFLNIFYQTISSATNALEKKSNMILLLSMLINDNFPNILDKQADLDTAYLLKNYIDGGNGLTMNLGEFENLFFQSKFYLEKKFKKAFGISIIEYRNKKRMNLAPGLLKNNSVSKVAELLGYQSIYSFSHAFKNYYGCSPRNHISNRQ